ARPVRPAGLGALAGGTPFRFPLPHRDLHARAQAGLRLLTLSLPARRTHRGPRGPQGRPAASRAARAGGACRAVWAAAARFRALAGTFVHGPMAGTGPGGSGRERRPRACTRRRRTSFLAFTIEPRRAADKRLSRRPSSKEDGTSPSLAGSGADCNPLETEM